MVEGRRRWWWWWEWRGRRCGGVENTREEEVEKEWEGKSEGGEAKETRRCRIVEEEEEEEVEVEEEEVVRD